MRLALPPLGFVALALAGLVLAAMLATLVAVLVSLEGTRSELRTTRSNLVALDSRVQRVQRQVDPVLAAAKPLDAAQVARTAGSLTRAAKRVPGLADDATEGVRLADAIAGQLGRSNLGTVLPAVGDLAMTALAGDRLARGLDGIDAVVGGLREPGAGTQATCDRRLRSRPPIASGQVGCLLRTVVNVRTLIASQRRLTARSIRVQLDTLSLTRQTTRLLTDSLTIQRELLSRVAAIDRKLPGPTGG